ncbi:MAG: histidine phosphatase family protein [Acidimicrobiales bacterium]
MDPISPTPQQVLLVRHGATEWSEGGRHTGRTDLPLLADGETEARQLHTKLQALVGARQPGLVLSSPMRRALDTCRLAGFGDHVQVDEDLAEWDYGEYEGRTTRQIQTARAGWELFGDGCPGGESIEQVTVRVERVIDRLRTAPGLTDRVTLVFAHGHVLRVLAALWAGIEPSGGRALPLDTGSVGILGWSHSGPAILRWNP